MAQPILPDLKRALGGMKKASSGYRKAHQYFEADAPEVFASARLRRAMRRNGMTLQMNFSATVVNSVVDRLEVASITTTEQGGNADDTLIQRVQKANKFQLQHVNWIRKACTYGDAYIMVWPKEDAQATYDPDPNGVYRHTFQPEDLRLIFQDPKTVRAFYNRDDPMVLDFVAKRWLTDEGRVRLDLYYTDRIECFINKEGTTGNDPKSFGPFSDAMNLYYAAGSVDDFTEEHVVPNPFGVIPFFHLRTDSDDYGKPEHKDFYPVHDAIHKLALGHLAGVDYQAFPQRYALMNPDADSSEAEAVDAGYFSSQIDDSGATRPNGGEGVANFKADPGSVWMADGIKDFGQFAVAEAKNFLEPMEFYLRCGATVTNTPLHYFEPAGTVPSGEALRTEEAPFIKKVKNRQLSFGDTLEELFIFVLTLLGKSDRTVTVRWTPAETWDDASAWEVATAKQAAGVPVEQTLLENGYSSDQLSEWEQSGQGDLPQRVQLFYQVGEALASFSSAVATGVVKQDQVVALMGQLLGDISAGGGEDDRIAPPANPIPDPPAPTVDPMAPDGQPHNQEQMSGAKGQQSKQRIMNNNAPPTSKPTLAPGTKGGQ